MGPAFSLSVLPGSNEVPLRPHPGYGRETGSQAGYPLGAERMVCLSQPYIWKRPEAGTILYSKLVTYSRS
jgi:hypothetical protein